MPRDFAVRNARKADAGVVEHAISVAAQDPSVQSAESDEPWISSQADLPINVFSPSACRSIREQYGVSLPDLARSFNTSDGRSTGIAGNEIQKKRRMWAKADSVIVSSSGHYVARSISEKQLKVLSKFVGSMQDHLRECPNSLLPRFYFIFSVKVEHSRSFEYWAISDNLDNVPLSILQRYDLKGCPFSRVTSPAEAERGEVLKDGNVEEVRKGVREFPSVNPLHARHLLDILSEDFALLEKLQVSNYSAYLIVSPAKGEEEEKSRAPRRFTSGPSKPPQERLGGPKATLFVAIVDVLQEWAAASKVKSMLSWFRGPAKAKEAKGAAPKEFSARLLAFLNDALQEHKAESQDIMWSHAVRTKASLMFVSPQQEQQQASPDSSHTPPQGPESDAPKASSLTFPFRRRGGNSIEPKAPKNRIEAKSAPNPGPQRWWEDTPDNANADDELPLTARRRLFDHQPPAHRDDRQLTPREISVGPDMLRRELSRGGWRPQESSPLPSPKRSS